MKKYNLSEIMKRAWELVKKAGCRMSDALKKAWKEAKEAKEEKKGMTVEKYLTEVKKLKIWEKYGYKRIYINDLKIVNLEEYAGYAVKAYNKVSMYYDINEDTFFTKGVTSSGKKTIDNLIAGIREKAAAA